MKEMIGWSAPKVEGWRWHMARYHYFREGESLCGKYLVRTPQGQAPRRPWLEQLLAGEAACEGCKELK
jgi:hypothetical protein